MTPLFPAGAEGVQISQQRMKKETRSTFKRSSEPFYLVTNLVVQFPEQPIADIYVLIMSK